MNFTGQSAKNQKIAKKKITEKKIDKAKPLPKCPVWWSDKKKRDAVNKGTHRY